MSPCVSARNPPDATPARSMGPMDETAIRAYVAAAAAAQRLALPPDVLERVAVEFLRIATIAAPVLEAELRPEVEAASSIPP